MRLKQSSTDRVALDKVHDGVFIILFPAQRTCQHSPDGSLNDIALIVEPVRVCCNEKELRNLSVTMQVAFEIFPVRAGTFT